MAGSSRHSLAAEVAPLKLPHCTIVGFGNMRHIQNAKKLRRNRLAGLCWRDYKSTSHLVYPLGRNPKTAENCRMEQSTGFAVGFGFPSLLLGRRSPVRYLVETMRSRLTFDVTSVDVDLIRVQTYNTDQTYQIYQIYINTSLLTIRRSIGIPAGRAILSNFLQG